MTNVAHDATAIALLLKGVMGLDASSIGVASIERAALRRVAELGLSSLAEYEKQLKQSRGEVQELVEMLVVPETWFFRDPEAFSALASFARERAFSGDAGLGSETIRLLSLPCSSGEEPLSMSMALLDAGIPPSRFRIDAIDISARAIAVAQAGLYGKNSFRGASLAFRDKHFESRSGKWAPLPRVREPVAFNQGNLFAPGFLPEPSRYDFVFCRNVLIYFDPATQARALKVILRVLKPGGYLFVAPSETGLLKDTNLSPSGIPMAFAFRLGNVAIPGPVPVSAAKVSTPASAKRVPSAGIKREEVASLPVRPSTVALTPSALSSKAGGLASHDEAQRLADAGHLEKAVTMCNKLLEVGEPSVRTLYLLALLHGALGAVDAAMAAHRKVVYLDPGNVGSLEHLALLLEKRGDHPGARVLRQRLSRLPSRGDA